MQRFKALRKDMNKIIDTIFQRFEYIYLYIYIYIYIYIYGGVFVEQKCHLFTGLSTLKFQYIGMSYGSFYHRLNRYRSRMKSIDYSNLLFSETIIVGSKRIGDLSWNFGRSCVSVCLCERYEYISRYPTRYELGLLKTGFLSFG